MLRIALFLKETYYVSKRILTLSTLKTEGNILYIRLPTSNTGACYFLQHKGSFYSLIFFYPVFLVSPGDLKAKSSIPYKHGLNDSITSFFVAPAKAFGSLELLGYLLEYPASYADNSHCRY